MELKTTSRPAAPVSDWPAPAARPELDQDRIDLITLFGALRRRIWLILLFMALGGGLVHAIASRLPPEYTATGQVMLDSRDTRGAVDGEVVPNLRLNEAVMNSEVSILKSNVLREAVVRQIGVGRLAAFAPPVAGATEAAEVRLLADQLERSLSVWREPNSYVISVSATVPDPALAAEIVDTMLQVYTSAQLSDRVATAQLSSTWLESRTGEVRAQVEEAERQVEEYRGARLIEDGGSLAAASQQLIELNGQLAQARGATRVAQARFDQISALVAQDGAAAALDILETPMIVELRRQRSDLSRTAAEIATRFNPDHPDRRLALAEIAEIDAELAREATNAVRAYRSELDLAQRNEAATEESLRALEGQVSQMSRSAITLRQLEREAEALRASYEGLLARLEETRTQVAVQQPDSRIVATAREPQIPSGPRVKLLTALGGLLGASLGAGIVLFSQLSRSGFQTAGQLQQATGLPVFDALAQRRWRSSRATLAELRNTPKSQFAERIRRVIQLLNRPGSAPRSIAVASSLPDEGKTTVSLALARMQVEAGRTVVLVDCDLAAARRSPWGPPADRCLADVLDGRCAPAEAILRSEPLGCDVLCFGKQERGSPVARLLTPDRIAALVADLEGRYDVVVIDTPPVHLVSEALSIGAAVDACLYLVRWDRTPRALVEHNLSALRAMGAKVPGLVLTRVEGRARRDGGVYG